MALAEPRQAPADTPAVATKAVLRAAARLSIPHKALARIIGVSEATVSRMNAGSYALVPGEKPFELALIFIRLFRSLDAMAGGDEAVARAWLRSENLSLGGTPLTLIQSVSGLVNVVSYLDVRRALA
jgi:antitoxin Xre/MbcA/ParS-like protein